MRAQARFDNSSMSTFLQFLLQACSVLAWNYSHSVQRTAGVVTATSLTLSVSTKHSSSRSRLSLCLSPSALRWGTVVVSLLILCTLTLFVDRLALRGGWVCFQFSPLPRPEKRHFQNQTNKTKKMSYNYFFSAAHHSVPLAHFTCLHDFEPFAVISVYRVATRIQIKPKLLTAEDNQIWASASNNSHDELKQQLDQESFIWAKLCPHLQNCQNS